MVSEKKCFFIVLNINLCKTCNPGMGPFLAQVHILNKLGRSLPGDATYIKVLGICGFREEDFFSIFLNISLCKTCYPQGRPIFGSRGRI